MNMDEKQVVVEYLFMAPGPVIRPIGVMTLLAATVAAGVREEPDEGMTPLDVLKQWPVEGWAALKAAVLIDHPGRGYNSLCATENTERQSNGSMATLCQRWLVAVEELYAEPAERVASCACVIWDDNGQPAVDIDRVTVDGIEMTREDFDRYIDRGAVEALALAKVKEGRE